MAETEIKSINGRKLSDDNVRQQLNNYKEEVVAQFQTVGQEKANKVELEIEKQKIVENALKPRLNINFFAGRTGVDNYDDNNTYMTFETYHHVFDIRKKNTGAVYAIESALSGRTTQKIVKSIDGGRSWVLIKELTVNISGGEKYSRIFVAPDSEIIVLFKVTPAGNKIETYYPTMTSVIGTLDIGTHTWLSSSHSIDSTYSGGLIIMFAEYGMDTEVVSRVWKTTDLGKTWTVSLSQTAPNGVNGQGEIRHFHTCQIDPHTGYWWTSTGDADNQCKIWRSKDNGTIWEIMASGNQKYRTCGFLFEKDYMYWGMDTPSNSIKSYIYKSDKNDLSNPISLGMQTDNQAIYMLTRTWFPAGFLIFPVHEPVTTPSNRTIIQFYDFARSKLYDIAEIPHMGLDTNLYTGFPNASRYQDTLTGEIFASISYELMTKYSIPLSKNVISSVCKMEVTL